MAAQQIRVEGYSDEHVAEFIAVAVPYNDHLGLVWDLVSPDRVEAHLDVQPFHLQPYGIVHGGVHCSLVEAVGSMAGAARAALDGKQAVGVHNATSFVRPVTGGRIEVTATPVHLGRSQHLWLVELRRPDGALVARGDLRMQVIDRMRV